MVTRESQQDLRSQHGLNAETLLTQALAQEIQLEIDREILADLHRNAEPVFQRPKPAPRRRSIDDKWEASQW